MYTMHCEDPNCVKCQQASKGQNSEEGNQSKIPETLGQSSEEEGQRQLLKTVEEVIAKDLLFAAVARGKCLSACSLLKEEVHCKISALMNILRERELDLCIEIEKECSAQVLKIDNDVTANCVDKIKKRCDENKRPHSEATLVFNSDFDALKRRLKCFGKLIYEDAEKVNKKWIQELRETTKRWDLFSAMAEDASPALSSDSPFGEYSKAASGAENSTPLFFVSPFEGDYKTTFSTKNVSIMSSDLAKYRNMNRLQLKEFRRELEEQNRRLKELSVATGEDVKIKFKDELSKDRQTNKTSLESEKDSKINFKDKLSVDFGTLQLQDIKKASEEQSCWLKEISLATGEELKIKLKDELSKERQTKKGFEAIASRTKKDKKRDEMAYRGFESTDSVPNNEVEMDSSSKRQLEVVHEILQRGVSADKLADQIRIRATGIEKCGEDNSLGKDSCKIKTLHQQLTGKDEPETFSAQIKKGFEVIASLAMQDKKRQEMAYRGFESTESLPNKEVGMDSSSKRQLEEVHEILQRGVSAEKMAGRIRIIGIEKCGEDNSLGKDSCKIKPLHHQLTGKDEPETLSAQIKKRFEVLADRTMKDQKRGEMAYRGFESTESVPNKEVGMDSSLQEKDRQFHSQQELLKKEFEELWTRLPVADLKRDKITTQSSESIDSSSSEEVEKDSSLDEDDIEIISRIETESIPPELSFSPPLPPKNRFKFGRKPSCFGSLLRKKEGRKPAHSPRNSAKSESSGSGESESQASSLISAVSSGSNAEMKENSSFNEQPHQESPSECLGGSKDEGRDINPTVALRSSFTKYLEKNSESEWLAPGKSSEQSLCSGNSGKERVVPNFVDEFYHWLPRECDQKMASDWLCPAHK